MTIVSLWPDLQPDPPPRPWVPPVVSLVVALVGGTIGWILAFVGLDLWGLAAGGVITLLLIIAVSRGKPTLGVLTLLSYGAAWALLGWLVLFVAVGLVRYWLTGQSLGN